jgi:hypothetical protein
MRRRSVDFRACFAGLPSLDSLNKARALLARWFRFQPSEIDGLYFDDFLNWLDQAADQAEQINEANEAAEKP